MHKKQDPKAPHRALPRANLETSKLHDIKQANGCWGWTPRAISEGAVSSEGRDQIQGGACQEVCHFYEFFKIISAKLGSDLVVLTPRPTQANKSRHSCPAAHMN